MNDEDTTFKQLKRVSFEEMKRRAGDSRDEDVTHHGIGYTYKVGNITLERDMFYDSTLARHYQLVRALENGGWTLDDYTFEMEKRALIEQVRVFNNGIVFPTNLLERAKKFYPNLKFTHAKLELE